MRLDPKGRQLQFTAFEVVPRREASPYFVVRPQPLSSSLVVNLHNSGPWPLTSERLRATTWRKQRGTLRATGVRSPRHQVAREEAFRVVSISTQAPFPDLPNSIAEPRPGARCVSEPYSSTKRIRNKCCFLPCLLRQCHRTPTGYIRIPILGERLHAHQAALCAGGASSLSSTGRLSK